MLNLDKVIRPAIVAAFALLLATASPAQDAKSETLSRVEDILLVEKSGTSVDIQGVVLEGFWGKAFALRDQTGVIIVRTKPGEGIFPEIGRGDLVTVSGMTFTEEALRTVVDAKEVRVLSKARGVVPSTRSANISKILTAKREGDVVSVIGQVVSQNSSRLEIKDTSGSITVELGPRFRGKVITRDAYVAVIGEIVSTIGMVNYINAFGVTEVRNPDAIGDLADNKNAKPLDKALDGVKAGSEIVVKGRIIKYVGKKTYNVIYDGTNTLIIDLAAGDQSDAEVGEEVVVKGTLDFVERDGQSFAVVRGAKMTRDNIGATK